MENDNSQFLISDTKPNVENAQLLRDMLMYFREKRESLLQHLVYKITLQGLPEGITLEEIETQFVMIYNLQIDCLEKGQCDDWKVFAEKLGERRILKEFSIIQMMISLITLRDIIVRSLFERYQQDKKQLSAAIDTCEAVFNENLGIVIAAYAKDREKRYRQQEEAIRELSTPVLQVRDRFLVLPIIGVLDTFRARQLTAQLLQVIRETRARVVVMDITGVPNVDSKVANHIVQTVEASRLLGATVIVTGISSEIAQTIVTLGIDLSGLKTAGNLQGGIEEADKILSR